VSAAPADETLAVEEEEDAVGEVADSGEAAVQEVVEAEGAVAAVSTDDPTPAAG
jgi:hypothetical protein